MFFELRLWGQLKSNEEKCQTLLTSHFTMDQQATSEKLNNLQQKTTLFLARLGSNQLILSPIVAPYSSFGYYFAIIIGYVAGQRPTAAVIEFQKKFNLAQNFVSLLFFSFVFVFLNRDEENVERVGCCRRLGIESEMRNILFVFCFCFCQKN